MRSIIVLGLLSTSMALLVTGCETGGEDETESVAQAGQAIDPSTGAPSLTMYFQINGGMLFNSYTLTQNCTLTLQTSGANSLRDPVFGIFIDNSLGWGSSTVPCHHGTYTATDSYTTLAYNDNISTGNYNAKVSYKYPTGGAGVTVFAVGFLNGTSQTVLQNFGPLTVNWSITGCNDTSKNKSGSFSQDFQTSGVYGSFPGYAFTNPPRPGGPQTASDTVLFELNPSVNGYNLCNDDCPASSANPPPPEAGTAQSCIANNSSSNMWYFSPNWYSVGSSSINW